MANIGIIKVGNINHNVLKYYDITKISLVYRKDIIIIFQ